ncbi:MFS transporter [Saccharothrix isguenensis]
MLTGLWRVADFRRLWLGQTLSMFGTHAVAVAVPLMAAVSLGASVFEMGLITAAEFAPYLLVSLFVGVWLDRRPKKPLIVLADVIRAAALLVIPVSWWMGTMSVPLLVGLVFVVGMCGVVADIGCAAILPGLVARARLVEGNAKLEVSASMSNIGGRTAGGFLVQFITAPITVLLTVVTYLWAAVATAMIRKREDVPEAVDPDESVWRSIGIGLRFIFGNATIRVLVVWTFLVNFFALAVDPVFLIFVTRELDLQPALIGVILSASGVGALLGALVADRVSRLLPFGWLVVVSSAGIALAAGITPLATLVPKPAAVALLVLAQMTHAVTVIVASVSVRSFRSAVTPDHLQGRMNASARMLVMAGSPFGAVFGGALGMWLGTLGALLAGTAGLVLATLLLAFSPVRRVAGIPEQVPAT